jgi:tetratricopeptide (TPR) repeat protein
MPILGEGGPSVRMTAARGRQSLRRIALSVAVLAVLAALAVTASLTAAAGDSPISGASVWNDRGIDRYRDGDYRTAITCFETAAKLSRDKETIRFNLASAHARLALQIARRPMTGAEYRDAVGEAEAAIGLFDGHAFFYSVLGFVHQEMGNHEEAYRAFARASELDPADSGARVLLGDAAYERDEIEEALEAWRTAVRIDPELGEVQERIEKADRERELEEDFRVLESPRFRIRYDRAFPDAGRLVEETRATLEDARLEVAAVLPRRNVGPISVVVYPPEEFRLLTDGCDWTGGLFDGKIRIPFPESGRADERFRALVRHEYVHALLYEWTEGRCPAWLNEGLAQALAGEWDAERNRRVPARSVFFRLSELEDSFLRLPADRVEAAYAEAYLVARYLLDEYTTRHLHALLERIGSGEETEKALRAVLHVTPDELLEEAVSAAGGKLAWEPDRP